MGITIFIFKTANIFTNGYVIWVVRAVHVWRAGRGGRCTRLTTCTSSTQRRLNGRRRRVPGCDDGTDRRRRKVKLHFGRRHYALHRGLVVATATYGRRVSRVKPSYVKQAKKMPRQNIYGESLEEYTQINEWSENVKIQVSRSTVYYSVTWILEMYLVLGMATDKSGS